MATIRFLALQLQEKLLSSKLRRAEIRLFRCILSVSDSEDACIRRVTSNTIQNIFKTSSIWQRVAG